MRTLLSLVILIGWKRNVEIIGNNCCSAVMWAARHMAHVLLQQMRNGRQSTCTIGTLTFWGGIAMHFPWNPTPRAAPSVVRGNFKPQASSSGLHLFSNTSLHKPKTTEHHFSYMYVSKTKPWLFESLKASNYPSRATWKITEQHLGWPTHIYINSWDCKASHHPASKTSLCDLHNILRSRSQCQLQILLTRQDLMNTEI